MFLIWLTVSLTTSLNSSAPPWIRRLFFPGFVSSLWYSSGGLLRYLSPRPAQIQALHCKRIAFLRDRFVFAIIAPGVSVLQKLYQSCLREFLLFGSVVFKTPRGPSWRTTFCVNQTKISSPRLSNATGETFPISKFECGLKCSRQSSPPVQTAIRGKQV